MKKHKLTPAILIFSMMILPANASAFWLDVVKEFVSGGIKTVVMPKAAKSLSTATTATAAVAESPPATKPSEKQQHSPGDIYDALNKLENICMDELVKYLPCAVGTEKSFSIGTARDKAAAKARLELAKNMGTYIDANTELSDKSEEDEAGVLKEASTYIAESKLTTKQLVSGAQQYLSYTYIDEEATELNKGRTVYLTTVVMVLNKELWTKALEDVSREKALSEQIIRESRRGIATIVRNALKKK